MPSIRSYELNVNILAMVLMGLVSLSYVSKPRTFLHQTDDGPVGGKYYFNSKIGSSTNNDTLSMRDPTPAPTLGLPITPLNHTPFQNSKMEKGYQC